MCSLSTSADHIARHCRVQLDEPIGIINIYHRLSVCSPAQLDIFFEETKEIRSFSTFIAGEQLELRDVGPDYWPLSLTVRFRPIYNDDWSSVNNNVSYYIQACLQVIRTGGKYCFLNDTVSASGTDRCNSIDGGDTDLSAAKLSFFVITLLLAAILLTVILSAVIIIRRKHLRKRPIQTNVYRRQSSTTAPILLVDEQSVTIDERRLEVIVEETGEQTMPTNSSSSSSSTSGHGSGALTDDCRLLSNCV